MNNDGVFWQKQPFINGFLDGIHGKLKEQSIPLTGVSGSSSTRTRKRKGHSNERSMSGCFSKHRLFAI